MEVDECCQTLPSMVSVSPWSSAPSCNRDRWACSSRLTLMWGSLYLGLPGSLLGSRAARLLNNWSSLCRTGTASYSAADEMISSSPRIFVLLLSDSENNSGNNIFVLDKVYFLLSNYLQSFNIKSLSNNPKTYSIILFIYFKITSKLIERKSYHTWANKPLHYIISQNLFCRLWRMKSCKWEIWFYTVNRRHFQT